MYHISILAGHQDEDDFGERLGDIASVAYCPVTNEEEMAEALEDTDVLVCHDEIISASLLEKLEDLQLIVVLR